MSRRLRDRRGRPTLRAMLGPVALMAWMALSGPRGAEGNVVEQSGCIAQLVVERSRSPWAGYTGSHQEEQAGYRVRAVDDVGGLDAPPHLEAYRVAGMPLLAIDRAHRTVVVPAAHFSDLERPDATQLGAGKRALVGKARSAAVKARPRDLVLFLLASEIVRTYAHLESVLCLVREETDAAAYTAHFQGEHTYFTNKRHQDRFAFRVEISSATGEIAVVGE